MIQSNITNLLLLLSAAGPAMSSRGPEVQVVFAPSIETPRIPTTYHDYSTAEAHEHLLQTIKAHPDPVDAYLALQPEAAAQLAEPRLLHVIGEQTPQWLTVGDKMRLRRKGKKFMDVTNYQDVYEQQQVDALAGRASKR